MHVSDSCRSVAPKIWSRTGAHKHCKFEYDETLLQEILSDVPKEKQNDGIVSVTNMESLTEFHFTRLDSTAPKSAQLQRKFIFCAAITLKDQIVREINFQVLQTYCMKIKGTKFKLLF